MRVLVACEASQKVCCAFRRRGIEAYSCDVQDCYGGFPQWHIKGDCLEIINDGWDLVIAHPPCTYLSKCQSNLMFYRGGIVKDHARYDKGVQAALFFRQVLDCNSRFLCVENPVMLKCWGIRPPDCIIQPYEFGHSFTKRTCLWLRNLPPLMPTDLLLCHSLRSWTKSVPGFSLNTKWKVSRLRSETFYGIAEAIADQYGSWVLSKLGEA